jgi:hypothetical protein
MERHRFSGGIRKGEGSLFDANMTISDAEIIDLVRAVLKLSPKTPVRLIPLPKRGSDRSYWRVSYGNEKTVIFMQYAPTRRENNYYVTIAGFLETIGISVPRIIFHEEARHFILMEDVGYMDLYALRNASWKVRREHYCKALEMVGRLHRFPVSEFPAEQVPLMESFGPTLYRWERDYFLENFVLAVCAIKLDLPESVRIEKELSCLAERLQEVSVGLIHRDFQSQNIMIQKEQPVFIDFQGMRFGNFFYDLGSLLYDPYVDFTEGKRMELLEYYYFLSDRRIRWASFKEMFREASAQRLMQALGAYGFLGLKKGHTDFLEHIHHALHNLLEITAQTKRMPSLGLLAKKCEASLSGRNMQQTRNIHLAKEESGREPHFKQQKF